MKYQYRSTCRFNMLVQIGSEIVQIRPNQIIESDHELNYSHLKDVTPKPKATKPAETPKKRRTRRKVDGNNSLS